MDEKHDVTELLLRWAKGEPGAIDELMTAVYAELRRLAAHQLRAEHKHRTLDTVGLVHEAYCRLIDQRRVEWHNRSHFFSIASRMMRRVLIDHARSQLYLKRGGGLRNLPLDDAAAVTLERAPEMLALDDALTDLARVDPELVQLVELRYFAGFSHREIGELTGQSSRTIDRRWQLARAWLYDELREDSSADEP